MQVTFTNLNGNAPKMGVVEWTPKKAAEALKTNKNNRRVRKARVLMFASMMKQGQWRLTHQGIAFDQNGKLIDGQHRLIALIESGATIPMVTIMNIDNKSTIGTVDTMAARTAKDHLHFDGLKFDHDGDAVARFVTKDMRSIGNANFAQDRIKEVAFFKKHRHAIEFACKLVPKNKGQRQTSLNNLTNVAIRAAIARAYYTVSEPALKHFFTVYLTGIPKDGEDHCIVKLRDRTMDIKSTTTKERSTKYRMVTWVLDKWLAGEGAEVNQIREAKIQLFLLPGEKPKTLIADKSHPGKKPTKR